MYFLNGLITSLVLCVTIFSSVANAEVVIIVSAKSTVMTLSADQIARIYLGKEDKFPNDQIAIPVDQQEGTAIRDEFYSKVAHKNPSQLSSYWAKLIFTGEGKLPKAIPDDNSVIKFVEKNSNAIGYIDEKSLSRIVSKKIRVVLKP
jgi:ABC-type phosphate transport system substrate-binding protein